MSAPPEPLAGPGSALGLGVELPEGTAFTGPREEGTAQGGFWVLGGCATAVDRAPGLLCFFPEETPAPREGLGPAGCGGGGDRYRFEQHPQPQNPPAFPTAYGRRTAGLGLGLRNLPSPGLSRSLWVLNAKDWDRASISPWALTGAT